MPGPPRKPTLLRIVGGNAAKRPLNKREPQPRRVVPPAPNHLSDEAKVAWARFAPVLAGMGVLTEADTFALERVCEVYVEVRQLQEALRRRGARSYLTVTEGGGKMVRAFPEVAMLADADRRFRGWLAEFGLTPAARSKVSIPPNLDEDPAMRFFR